MRNVILIILVFYLSIEKSFAQLFCQGNIPVTTVSVDITGWHADGALGDPQNTMVSLCGFPPTANIVGLEWTNMQYNTLGDTWCNEVELDLDGELIIYVNTGGSNPGPCGPYAGGSPTILQQTGLQMTASISGCIELESYLTYLQPPVGADFTSGIITFTACPQASPLPVTLKNFDVYAVNKQHKLQWTSTKEINNRGWHIQRSGKGIEWETIGWKNGFGNTNMEKSYNFTDPQPMNGLNFYRLKQVDFDNLSSYSDVKYLEFKIDELKIYPNPVIDKLYIDGAKEDATYTVVDINGQHILVGHITNQLIDLSSLKEGSYLLRLENSGEVIWRKLIKVN